ncbi:MAG: hypothetical protein HOP21_09200 [Methylotenera sp.]|nr:hypothetical protein [Methylotenera sp.]
MHNTALSPHQILTGEYLYNEAVALVLSQAQRELLIFDQDLSLGNFSSMATQQILTQFLSQSPNSQLTIILQSTLYFSEKCPRIFNLLATFSHKMRVFETNDHAKHAKDCFILADGEHYIKRIHIDQARFKYALNNPLSTQALNTRFEELLDATHNQISYSTLGI